MQMTNSVKENDLARTAGVWNPLIYSYKKYLIFNLIITKKDICDFNSDILHAIEVAVFISIYINKSQMF